MTHRRFFSIAMLALLAAVLGFGGVLQSCQPPNKAPFARFTFSPKEPKINEAVTFDGSGSRDPDGKIISYLWDFGDGETAQGATTTHVFKRDGEYDVILHVTDDRGSSTALAKTVRVVPPNQAPVAIFTVEPLEPTANQEVTFDASAAADPDGTIVSYRWDFGDQTTGQGKTVTHAYQAAGTYKVTLTVTDDKGATSSAFQHLVIKEPSLPPNQPPLVTFSFTPINPKVNQPIAFDAAGSTDDGEIVLYFWEFGDGDTAEGQTVTHTYKTAGTFTVKLTLTDDRGAKNSLSRTVTVRQ
ncbi:MAG: PKD domain-containing protein [Candidatus Bipolaricaulota bacterium]|nr:PKD domain-containing protein [Candidatus Bipolaricaulota bacterium]